MNQDGTIGVAMDTLENHLSCPHTDLIRQLRTDAAYLASFSLQGEAKLRLATFIDGWPDALAALLSDRSLPNLAQALRFQSLHGFVIVFVPSEHPLRPRNAARRFFSPIFLALWRLCSLFLYG